MFERGGGENKEGRCLNFKQMRRKETRGAGGRFGILWDGTTPLLVALPSAPAIPKKFAKFMQPKNMLNAFEIKAFACIFYTLEITQI